MAALVADIEEPTERIEAEVCTLAGQIAAATCRFVLLVAELDRRGAWAEWGCRSMAHWLSWRCALGIVAARQHVRVGRALEELPRITEQFAAGRFSYSKVRALTRVATPAREAELIEFATVATAAQVERTIRAFERTRGDTGTERARLAARRVRFFAEEDGMDLLDGRLTREQSDVLKRALEQAEKEVPRDVDDSAESRRADALELIARAFLAGRSDRVPTEVVVHVEADELAEDELTPFVERMMCDTSVHVDVRRGDEHVVGERKPTIPIALRRAIKHHDQGVCRFRGCTNERFTHVHHLAHRIRGGPTNTKNCCLLCTFHHRMVHEGGWSVWGDADGTLLFVSPSGRRFTDAPEECSLETFQPMRGINARTIEPGWYEPLDISSAVDAMETWFPMRD